jgi:hypothetical protein
VIQITAFGMKSAILAHQLSAAALALDFDITFRFCDHGPAILVSFPKNRKWLPMEHFSPCLEAIYDAFCVVVHVTDTYDSQLKTLKLSGRVARHYRPIPKYSMGALSKIETSPVVVHPNVLEALLLLC